jgi:hypothetical protein
VCRNWSSRERILSQWPRRIGSSASWRSFGKQSFKQYCGTGTGTARTIAFCLSGIGTAMHYGSGSGSELAPRLWIRI